MSEKKTTEEELIACPVTRWYLRRIGLMAALFAGLSLYFLYDGVIGYPRQNFHADLFEAFEAGKDGHDLDSFILGHPELGPADDHHREFGAAIEAGGNSVTWAAFAATRHLGEAKPERHSLAAVRQQIIFAWILGILAFGAIGFGFFQKGRSLRAGPDWLETGSGRRIAFSEITAIDFSRWDRGIARLNLGANGQAGRIRIDDYKFSGAAEILQRIREVRPEIESEAWPDLERKNPGNGRKD